MLNTKLLFSQTALIPILHKPFVLGNNNVVPSFRAVLKQPSLQLRKRHHFCTRSVPSPIKATATSQMVDTYVKVAVNVQFSGETPKLLGSLTLELASTKVHCGETPTIKGRAVPAVNEEGGVVRYVTDRDMLVPAGFGEIGAVLVVSEIENKEVFIEDIELSGAPHHDKVFKKFSCRSWVQPKSVSDEKRVFFTSKSYLPSQTPAGLRTMRDNELRLLRGDGRGERKPWERIYDYDVYNDLGDPDKCQDLVRPVLGGTKHPYPRRGRTGRPPTKTDPNSESKSDGPIYVPRDEAFSDIKAKEFNDKLSVSMKIGMLATQGVSPVAGFPNFTAIDLLFSQGVDLEVDPEEAKNLQQQFQRIIKTYSTSEGAKTMLKFDTPELMIRDKFSWLKDAEFGRQTLAGLNPYSIRLVTEQEWPLKSKLDPETYGPPESKITAELIEPYIKEFMTVEEALKNKKLFILDYHDLFLPYVNQVREIKRNTLYGSRTLFFLTPSGSLIPIAIELTRPPGGDNKTQWKEVFQPSLGNATETWLWKLAKSHVQAHDAGYHQLISHWLRTHCCMEPYVIAANRQLSAMHPIYRLLHPYFRYTMAINGARQQLVSAGGIIESTFFPGKYSMRVSSDIYDKLWKFNLEGLPADLIQRGLAVEDKNAEHGLKLAIEDYPFANDGLILWDAIKGWVTSYVNHYYHHPSIVHSDKELQAWWTEVRTVGHGDKKNELWWPFLNTPKDLIGILTTIIWVASGHHAAVNFGQYDYAAYTPNRPSVARTNMPTEDQTNDKWANFKEMPENEILSCFPSQVQATTVMAITSVLSDHSSDEEYIGDKIEPSWEAEPEIKNAFDTFNGRMKELERTIDARNADESLINRNGAGVVPYKLLMPFSGPGVTGKGVPNSITI